MEAWLLKQPQQPREVPITLAARAALRALPFVEEALRYKPHYIVLPVFRAVAFAWAAARYSIATRGYAAPSIDLAHFSPNPTAASNAAFAAQAAHVAVSTPSLAAEVCRCADDAFRAAVDSAATAAPASYAPYADEYAGAALYYFWSAVSADATRVEEGAAASDIAGLPLWPQGQPDQLRSLWQEMKATLLAEKDDWQVWTDWYEDRLAGHVRAEEHELAYVRIEETLWNQGPANVNAEIKRRIEKLEPPTRVVELSASGMTGSSSRASLSVAEPAISPVPADNPPIGGAAAQHHSEIIGAWQSADAASAAPHPGRQYVPDVLLNPVAPADTPAAPIEAISEPSPVPEIPPQRPAALEPVWSNGKLVLPTRPARTDGDKRVIAAALKGLRAELVELADDVEAEPSNFDKRAATYLRRIAERIPDRTPPQHELFRLAHAKEVLEGQGSTINDQWPDHLAPRFHALTLLFDRVVRQFPKWREFVRNAQEDRLTAEQVAEVPAISVMVLSALREEDAKQFIDREIPEALEQLQQPPQAIAPNDSAQPLVLEDVVESINNIVKEAVAAALDERAKTKADSKPRPSREKVAKGFGHVAKEAATGYRDEAQKSFVKEAKRLGKETGPAITRWAKRLAVSAGGAAGVSSLAHTLIETFPDKFGWLDKVINHLF